MVVKLMNIFQNKGLLILTVKINYFLRFLKKILERWEGKERERNINVWLPLMCPQLGTWPATQACALTGNQTSDPLICRLALNHWGTPASAKKLTIFKVQVYNGKCSLKIKYVMIRLTLRYLQFREKNFVLGTFHQ